LIEEFGELVSYGAAGKRSDAPLGGYHDSNAVWKLGVIEPEGFSRLALCPIPHC
jgi:hypothetical protein